MEEGGAVLPRYPEDFAVGGIVEGDEPLEFVRQMLVGKVLPPGLVQSLGAQRRQLLNGVANAVPQLLLMRRGR